MHTDTGWNGRRVTGFWWLALLALWLALSFAAEAQTTVQPGTTLHVYAHLLQIPVLILDRHGELLPPIPAAEFSVRLGKEAPFKPGRVRLEGEDPITLVILVDNSARDTLLPEATTTLPIVADESMRAQDRVAVYAMDGCKLRRLSPLLPASRQIMADSLMRAAAFERYDPTRQGTEHCAKPIGLWDATEYLARSLAGEAGRRVVLALTNGQDHGSQMVPEAVARSATGMVSPSLPWPSATRSHYLALCFRTPLRAGRCPAFWRKLLRAVVAWSWRPTPTTYSSH